MTELAIRQTAETAPAVQAIAEIPQPQSALMAWAEEARVVGKIAVSIAATSFAGQLRGKPQEVTAVILAGNELGLKPMASLKAMDIIQGTPALRAHAMRGLVQSHGHKIQLVESSPKHCVMRGRRSDEEEWQTVTWTIERAAALGLLGKDQWKKQPQTMLIARATGELCRLIASDVLHGVPYTAEELHDTTPVVGTVVSRPRLSVAAITTAAPAQSQVESAPAATWAESGGTTDGTDDFDGENPMWDTQQPTATNWPDVREIPNP